MNSNDLTIFRQFTAFAVGAALLATLHGCGETSPEQQAATTGPKSSQSTISEVPKTTTDVPSEARLVEEATAQAGVPSDSLPTSASSLSGTRTPDDVPDVALALPQRFRLPDDRPKLNHEKLRGEGLRIVESEHLILVTDLPLESVANLPPLADALFATLEKRLEKLAPDIPGSTFQVTGFLMDARDRFERAGVLPPEEFPIRHGRHLGYEFWINNQTADYYRRHLLLHEFIHCFMMCEYGMRDIPPLWYTEGIAEYYATHQLNTDVTKSEFGVLPQSTEGFEGWHRIAEIRRHVNEEPSALGELADIVSLETVLNPPSNTFQDDSQYANAWALVWLINHHPELQPQFAAAAACRTQRQFNDAMAEISESTWKQLDQVWPLYIDGLQEADASTVRFPALTLLKPQKSNGDNSLPTEFTVEAGQQWVSTGLALTAGQEIVVQCTGRYIVEETTKPWASEPDGITIDYVRGRPLGEVIGAIISTDGTQTTRHIPIGTTRNLRTPIDGILWLQINDDWAEREKNQGSVLVQISAGEP